MQTVKELIRDDHETLNTTQTTSEALKHLESSKDLVVVIEDGSFKGVITAEQVFRHEVTNQGQKINAVYKSAPKVNIDTELPEALRLLYEDDLKIIPIFDDDRLIGVVHLNDVLDAVINDETAIRAKDIMSTKMISADPDEAIKQVMGKLRNHKITRMPVVDHTGKPQGIISVYDIVRKFHKPQDKQEASERNQARTSLHGEKHSPFDVEVKSVMQRDLTTAHSNTKLPSIINLMHGNDVGSVLLVDDKNRLEGIITRRDILNQLVQEYHESDRTVDINIATNIDNIGRDELTTMIANFVEKFQNSIGHGHINLHVSRHKERRGGQSLLYGRLHVRCQKAKHHVTAEGYGPRHLTRNLLRKLRTLILKHHQDQQQVSTAEYFEHFDITSL
jgi:predicted transcriptional regulator